MLERWQHVCLLLVVTVLASAVPLRGQNLAFWGDLTITAIKTKRVSWTGTARIVPMMTPVELEGWHRCSASFRFWNEHYCWLSGSKECRPFASRFFLGQSAKRKVWVPVRKASKLTVQRWQSIRTALYCRRARVQPLPQ